MEFNEKQKKNFWAKVNKTESCWLWTACCDKVGYGQFKFNGNILMAHRISWFLSGQTIPATHIIRHKCLAKNCVNPAHLETGTMLENAADRRRDGTNGNILTEAQVHTIRTSEKTQRELGIEFGVNRTTVSAIKIGRTWAWLK